MKPVFGVIIPVEGPVEVIQLRDIGDYQFAVGGYIEAVRLPTGETMYINEEGKLMGLPINERATALAGMRPRDVIVGNALVVGPPTKRGNDTSLPPGWAGGL